MELRKDQIDLLTSIICRYSDGYADEILGKLENFINANFIQKPEFEYGQLVEVSNDEINWSEAEFVAQVTQNYFVKGPNSLLGFSFCRPRLKMVRLTIEEIAEKLGIQKSQLQIVRAPDSNETKIDGTNEGLLDDDWPF